MSTENLNPTFAFQANQNAPVYCTKSIAIQANAQLVWQLLAGIDQWSEWHTEITYAKAKGPLSNKTHFSWKTGGAHIQSQMHTFVPTQLFGWSGKAAGMKAIHNWELKTEGKQTIVIVSESMAGLIALLIKKMMNKSLASGMQHWLEALKAEAEKREVAQEDKSKTF